jgi:uracil-DNA glycosylase
MKTRLEKALEPIYKEMLQSIEVKNRDIYTFCMQWSKNFPLEENKGILFVGKATNGWISSETDIDILFGEHKSQIFNREDQIKWILDLEGKKSRYNTRKSAFWRVIRKISKAINGDNELDKIAWSNLYKVSYTKENPPKKLQKMQLDYCEKILETEIEILSPKYVVFFTSGWEKEFLKHLNQGSLPKYKTINWGKNYKTSVVDIENIKYITSVHPQGKKEKQHSNIVVDLLIKND